VNAEKLEGFLIENLSRVADDKQYIENLAYKIAHESPRPTGVELSRESSKNLATRVSQVLMEFKNKIQKATQVEKCLIFQKTVQGIKFYKEHLEVIVFIKDTNALMVEEFFQGQSGRLAQRAREGAVNPDAPACSTSSILYILTHRLHLIPETWVTLFVNNSIAEVRYAMERECYCG